MEQITAKRTMHFSKEEVWSVLDDFDNIHKWNPCLKDSHGTSSDRRRW
ncbi:SRPBCC family protein [Flagellimonas sp. S174]